MIAVQTSWCNLMWSHSKDTATILSIEGRLFDVDIHYVKRFAVVFITLCCYCLCFSPVPDYVRVTIDTIAVIHKQEAHGDVLAFLTGQVCFHHPCVCVCVCVCVSVCLCVCHPLCMSVTISVLLCLSRYYRKKWRLFVPDWGVCII